MPDVGDTLDMFENTESDLGTCEVCGSRNHSSRSHGKLEAAGEFYTLGATYTRIRAGRVVNERWPVQLQIIEDDDGTYVRLEFEASSEGMLELLKEEHTLSRLVVTTDRW